ncbi:unnamed protein product [Rotaria sordida]|uniref:DNA helicase MCM8 n=1 Tax=Rotaria sordida TaxID=392033 RepID=A0A813MEW1_9BILA|nr:unnamed protein product [Rotaria sordida]CAF0797351.1 unnamed protein product [Rotaria sordida]
MAPGQKKPQQNGQKKKGYNPYNKFKNQFWKKKKKDNENSSKQDDGRHNQNYSHIGPSSPIKFIQTPITKYINITEQPERYRGWSLYFPDTDKESDPSYLSVCQLFEDYFRRMKNLYDYSEIEQKQSFTINYHEVLEDSAFQDKKQTWSLFFSDQNETTMRVIGLAMHQCIIDEQEEKDRLAASECHHPTVPLIDLPIIHARLVNFTPMIRLKDVKAQAYGKLVSIRGVVVRVSNSQCLVVRLAYECSTCRHTFGVTCENGKHTEPERCPTPGCIGRSFVQQRSHPLTTIIDWQTIRLQEVASEASRAPGRIPQTIECELTNDLVNSAIPGDAVVVSGVVKLMVDENSGLRKISDQSLLQIYIDVNSVVNQRLNTSDSALGGNSLMNTMDFSLFDLYGIQQIQQQKNVLKLLVHSLCPSIYGHELVKAALLMALFGGLVRNEDGACHIPIRSDPHILIVGDPGLGKSQLLHACVSIAPRGVYVCGTSSTQSGLTVTLHKDKGGDLMLDAGALVMAHQGCCCIDEFDKMITQQQVLLEAMEQQCVSIAKGGIMASIPARTCVIAAANPVGGHYNKGKTVAENLKLKGPILSRFDLVFILIDRADDELDYRLSEHVLAQHNRSIRSSHNNTTVSLNRTQNEAAAAAAPANHRQQQPSSTLYEEIPLLGELRLKLGESIEPVGPTLLQKYIAYARRYVKPRLTRQAIDILKKFYFELRMAHQRNGTTPITLRQLESLMRLTEARAKLELREECTESDALDVVQIMEASMLDTYTDENGQLDFSRLQHGSGMSRAAEVKKMMNAIRCVCEKKKNPRFSIAELKQIATDIKINMDKFDELLIKLNDNGYLLKKGHNVYDVSLIE